MAGSIALVMLRKDSGASWHPFPLAILVLIPLALRPKIKEVIPLLRTNRPPCAGKKLPPALLPLAGEQSGHHGFCDLWIGLALLFSFSFPFFIF
jgi:hypothetical protein